MPPLSADGIPNRKIAPPVSATARQRGHFSSSMKYEATTSSSEMAEVSAAAPVLTDHLDDESREHFAALCDMLGDGGLEFVVNPRLVRGLDYYSRTVFEWITTELGAQGTVCAGGRYDGLVELMGGRQPVPAVGFAMGLERLLELRLQQAGAAAPAPALYVVATGGALDRPAMALAERLRDAFPGRAVMAHLGGGSMKSRMKKADRSGADVAIILGEDEYAAGAVTVKPLRADAPQQRCAESGLAEVLASLGVA